MLIGLVAAAMFIAGVVDRLTCWSGTGRDVL
jgi:hypothetical protein